MRKLDSLDFIFSRDDLCDDLRRFQCGLDPSAICRRRSARHGVYDRRHYAFPCGGVSGFDCLHACQSAIDCCEQ